MSSGMLRGLATWSVVCVASTFLVAPILLPVTLSFSETPYMSFPPVGFSLQWYEKIFSDGEFLASLWLSIKLAAIVTVLGTILGTAAALGVRRLPFGVSAMFQSALLSPLVMPTLVTGIALLQFFNRINTTQTFLNLVIGHLVVTTPYVVRSVTASIAQMTPAIEDAGRTLGAGSVDCFLHITMPQIKSGIVVGGIFVFVMSFDNYPVSMWLADAQNMPLPLTAYRYIQRFFDPTVAAVSTVMIVISLTAVLLMERVTGLRKAWGA